MGHIDSGRTRVVQVIGSMHIGGAENAVVHLARGLDRARFDVGVCCTMELGVLADELKAEGVDVVLAAPGSRRTRYLTPLTLHRALRRFAPHVVHTHGTPGLLHVGPLAMLGMAPRWVHTFHYGNYPLPNRRQMQGERLLCRATSQMVAVSDVQRESVIEHHGISPGRILTIVNGVPENPFLNDPSVRARYREDLGFAPDEIVIGCVAVLSEQKGITYLLQAFRALAAEDSRLRLLVAGGGPSEQALRAEAEALGLGRRAVFTGWRTDNRQLLTVLDVFVMASLWEAMPLALLEAMAARRPIVVTDVGQNRRIVNEGDAARLVPAKDPEAIAAAVRALVTDRAGAESLAARGQQRFREQFTIAHMLARHQQLYEDLRRRS
jgi:glycosyltransferase involved in cell wall biosynthesis